MDKKGKIAMISALILVGLLVLSLAYAARSAIKACRDGVDNDGDGFTDYPADPGCSSKNDDSELNLAIACDDGTDNDGDGYADMNDPGCSSPSDTSEYSTLECDDGSDNDGDGATDMSDTGCGSLTDNDESDCGDGVCEGGETPETCNEDCPWPDSCSDSDAGYDPNNFGTVSGYDDGSPYSYDDYCISGSLVMEHQCAGTFWFTLNVSCVTNMTTQCLGGECN
ncbi:MAG: hypothetical protein ABIH34_08285 [Nanoarchaeota archaeon]